jgi:hypothetical protein
MGKRLVHFNMKKTLIILFCLIPFVLNGQYWVTPRGNDTNTGLDSSSTGAWLTWRKAFATADAGDTVQFRGGIYMAGYDRSPAAIWHSFIAGIKPLQGIGHTGTQANPIVFMAYQPDYAAGNFPILDCDTVVSKDWLSVENGIEIEYAEYIKLKGLTVRNLRQGVGNISQGISSLGANFTFENCVVHDIGGRGFTPYSAAWSSADANYAAIINETSPVYSDYLSDSTYFINCDAYNIIDSLSVNPGNAGDGWKGNIYVNNFMSFVGCRAWNYSDDGIDVGGGRKIFYNTWVMSSAKYAKFEIEGNGFKVTGGASDYFWNFYGITPPILNDTILMEYNNCISVFCTGVGFYNNLFGNIQEAYSNRALIYNNISYKCLTGFSDTREYGTTSCYSVFRNNISYSPNDVGWPLYMTYMNQNERTNTWDSKQDYTAYQAYVTTDTVTVSSADFIEGLDSLTIVNQVSGSRKADGSLPDMTVFRLNGTSDLIGAGTDVGMSSVPDIGVDWAYVDAQAAPDDPTATDILTFVVASQVGSTTVNATNHTITVHMPFGTNLTALQPTITLSPLATVSPTSGTATNFTNPVNYTVTGGDAVTSQVWVVTITNIDPDTNTDILTFTLAAQTGAASIDLVNHTVSIEVAYNTTVTSLSPTITVYGTATINPTSGTARNFTNPVTYTVTAQDAGTTQVWTVTVTVDFIPDGVIIYSNSVVPQSVLATSGGNVTSDGGATITERGIVWGTSANPTTANNKIVASGTTGVYSVQIRGLLGNTTYHARSYAINSVGTSYGSNVSFTTPGSSVATSGGKVLIFIGLPAIWE